MPKQNPYKNPEISGNGVVETKKKEEPVKSGSSKDYHYSYVDMEEVMARPEEYIIPELQEACKELWAKNIFTNMVSDRDNTGDTYIVLETLSEENQAVFDELAEHFPDNFKLAPYRKRLQIRFHTEAMTQEEIASKFKKAISLFVPQDVQDDFYRTREEFLLECGCFKMIPNPEYDANVDPMQMLFNGDLAGYDLQRKKTIKLIEAFDETKVEKPLEEYVKEKGLTRLYDPGTKRIYNSEFFLNRHKEYVKSQSEETHE